MCTSIGTEYVISGGHSADADRVLAVLQLFTG